MRKRKRKLTERQKQELVVAAFSWFVAAGIFTALMVNTINILS